MNTSDLDDTLNSSTSAVILAEKISQEIAEYALLLQKKGSSIPVHFNEDKELVLSKSSVRKLLSETSNGNLSNIHLAYICDCLTLGEKVIFENENLKELIFDLADPEINGGYKTHEEVQRLLDKI